MLLLLMNLPAKDIPTLHYLKECQKSMKMIALKTNLNPNRRKKLRNKK